MTSNSPWRGKNKRTERDDLIVCSPILPEVELGAAFVLSCNSGNACIGIRSTTEGVENRANMSEKLQSISTYHLIGGFGEIEQEEAEEDGGNQKLGGGHSWSFCPCD